MCLDCNAVCIFKRKYWTHSVVNERFHGVSHDISYKACLHNRPLGYERVHLPLCKVADAPFYLQGDELLFKSDKGSLGSMEYGCESNFLLLLLCELCD